MRDVRSGPALRRTHTGAALLLASLLLAATPVLSQMLSCTPVTGTDQGIVPEGGFVVIELGPTAIAIHGCLPEGCQPVTGRVDVERADADEVVFVDPDMGIRIALRRSGMPLAATIEWGEDRARTSLSATCVPQ